jgi:hypothetical protein
MGLRGLFDALTKIAARPEKDFGELVRQRRRKRGLPVTLAAKILPCLSAIHDDDSVERAVLDRVAESVLEGSATLNELRIARECLSERRMAEALVALEAAALHGVSARQVARLEQIYACELAAYSQRCVQEMVQTLVGRCVDVDFDRVSTACRRGMVLHNWSYGLG